MLLPPAVRLAPLPYNMESMPELEIHHEVGHAIDPLGHRIGVLAAILAVALGRPTPRPMKRFAHW